VAQDLTQIYAAYGREEAVTVNCDTTVAFAPNKVETAQALSKLAGETTVRHAHRTVSSAGTSISEPEVGRPLVTPDEVRRLGANEVLIFTRGHPVIRAKRLEYHQQEVFKRRAAIAVPPTSDRIVTAHLVQAEQEQAVETEASSPSVITTAASITKANVLNSPVTVIVNQGIGEKIMEPPARFLNFAAGGNARRQQEK
jgi:type IV secretory pathway TraG/TraD family ATPase VirD4